MKLAFRILIGLGVVVTAPAAAFFAIGPERVWTRMIGPGDQGSVDPRILDRRKTPTDALACTQGLCAAHVDMTLGAYSETPAALMGRLDAVVLADTDNITRVDDGSRPNYRRYVARTKIMRFPDTIDALAEPSGKGTGLALYGRSQLGKGDWGVNRGRIEGWLELLGTPKPLPLAHRGPPIS